ncbi:Uncharacterised protein [Klebsiella pneumoniae]|nr:Uncharacterised protein [Klebsiella pneumoniae]
MLFQLIFIPFFPSGQPTFLLNFIGIFIFSFRNPTFPNRLLISKGGFTNIFKIINVCIPTATTA